MMKEVGALILEYEGKVDRGNEAAHAAVCVLKMMTPDCLNRGWLISQYKYESERKKPARNRVDRAFCDKRIEYKLAAIKQVAGLLTKEEL